MVKPLFLHELRVIPAWAGNTPLIGFWATTESGHPRVGGEHSNCKQLICREFTACKRATEQYTESPRYEGGDGTACPDLLRGLTQSRIRRQNIDREWITVALKSLVVRVAQALRNVRSATTGYRAVWISSRFGL